MDEGEPAFPQYPMSDRAYAACLTDERVLAALLRTSAVQPSG
jgi:hypothetical protein